MIGRLVPPAVFKTVVPTINRELGSIPRRSRKSWVTCLNDTVGKRFLRVPVKFD